jgi:DNA-binding response OmpR family regulator
MHEMQQKQSSMQVLVVEDDADTSALLLTLLKRHNYEGIPVDTGEAAIRLMDSLENAPSLILLDWMMPGLSGIEVLKRLRKRKNFLYIIMVSAMSRDKIKEAIKAGCNDYIEKPFDPEELLSRLRIGATLVELNVNLARRLQQVGMDMEEIKDSIRGEEELGYPSFTDGGMPLG